MKRNLRNIIYDLLIESTTVRYVDDYVIDGYRYFAVPQYKVYFYTEDQNVLDEEIFNELDEAKKYYESLGINDFSGDKTDITIGLSLEKYFIVYESEIDLDYDIEGTFDDASESDKSIYEIEDWDSEYEYEIIESKGIDALNGEQCMYLEVDIENFLNKKYGRAKGKYQYLYFDSEGEIISRVDYYDKEEDEEMYEFLVRVSDHSRNPKNDIKNTYDTSLSFVVADIDKTATRFHGDDIIFNCEMDWEYIKNEIEIAIQDNIEEVLFRNS